MDNNKLLKRQFENIYNTQKRCSTQTTQLSINQNDSDNDSQNSKLKIQNIEHDDIDRGMPMRSQYNPKKYLFDANKYLDFNLYEQKPKKSKVKFDSNFDDYADVGTSMVSMTQQINPIYVMNMSLDKFGTILFKKMYESIRNDNFIVSSFGLYSLFCSLYLISNYDTEIEFKKFFNFSEKESVMKSMIKIFNEINKIDEMVNIKNFLIYGNNIPNEKTALDKILKFCMIASVDIKNPKNEADKLTFIINKLLKNTMRNPITISNIENLQIMLMTTSVIHPIWTFSFKEIIIGNFLGFEKNRKQKYIVSYNKVFSYFEDNEKQLLEIKCGNGELMFGLIMHKKIQINETNQNIQNYIQHMKQITLEEVRIPIFTQDLKIRYTNIIKKLGLQTIYMKLSTEAFPEGNVIIHDIIQNVKIIIDEKSMNLQNNLKGEHSIQKFIADKPFLYYFRLTKTNTILFNGLFQ